MMADMVSLKIKTHEIISGAVAFWGTRHQALKKAGATTMTPA